MSCIYYRYNGGILSGDYWCDKKNQAVNDKYYYKYCRDYNYDECAIYKQSESSGCFITTITCQILDLPDNHIILNILRDFRNNILQPNKAYAEILMCYDSIGPLIAEKLKEDKHNEKLAQTIYKTNLIPISCSILNEDYQTAIKKYQTMTQNLINYYNLNDEYITLKENNYNFNDYNQLTGGHGRVLKRK